jgi:thioesterase domain-containing protein
MWIARRKARTALRSVRDRELLEALGRQIHPTRSDSPVPGRLSRLRDAHTTRPFDFPAALVFSEEVMEEWAKGWYPPWFFESVVRNPSRWKVIPSLHERLLLPPAVDDVAAEIRAALDQAAGSRAAA